jgi:hypothetical protein
MIQVSIICRHGPWKFEEGEWRAIPRTPATVHDQNQKFVASGGKLKNAKLFFSCISKPILVKEDDPQNINTPILLLSIPPSLHLKLAFNSIMTDLLKAWPELVTFLKSKHIPTEAYHGGGTKKVVLEGNQVLNLAKWDHNYSLYSG